MNATQRDFNMCFNNNIYNRFNDDNTIVYLSRDTKRLLSQEDETRVDNLKDLKARGFAKVGRSPVKLSLYDTDPSDYLYVKSIVKKVPVACDAQLQDYVKTSS